MAVGVNYVLGNSEVEHQRLMMQSRMLRPWTERFFRAAGVRPGMSVIELGCGVGDVSLIAAGMVGPGGSVLSLDRDPVYLARANQRVMAEGCADVVTLQQAARETTESAVLVGGLDRRHVLRCPRTALATPGCGIVIRRLIGPPPRSPRPPDSSRSAAG